MNCTASIIRGVVNSQDSFFQALWVPERSKFIYSGASSGKIITLESTDSTNWVKRDIDVDQSNATAAYIAWSSTVGFVLWGNGFRYYTSPDGNNWTARAKSGDLVYSEFITYYPEFGGRFFVGGENAAISTSADGVQWSPVQVTSVQPTTTWNKMIWATELNYFFLVHSIDSRETAVSANEGTFWSLALPNFPFSTRVLVDWLWCKERRIFMALCTNDYTYNVCEIFVSTNGIVWNKDTSAPVASNWMAIGYAPELDVFYAIQYNSLVIWRPGEPSRVISTMVNKRYYFVTWVAQWNSFILSDRKGYLARVVCTYDSVISTGNTGTGII